MLWIKKWGICYSYNDQSEMDSNMMLLTDVIYDACYSVFGRTVKIKKQSQSKRKTADWFNDQCRTSKGVFYKLSVLLKARTRRKIKLHS